MQGWRIRVLLIAALFCLPFEIMLLIALWPYLPWVGKAFMGFLVTCFVCGSAAVIDWAWKRIRAPRVIVSGEVVVMITHDGYEHLSAKQEEAKRPLMLQSPRQTPEDHRSTEETVLELHSLGIGFQKIAEATGWTPYQVRKLCNNKDGKPM